MRNRLKNIKDKIENKISGTFAEPLPLRKQMTRMIHKWIPWGHVFLY